jgi:hypothetical protein
LNWQEKSLVFEANDIHRTTLHSFPLLHFVNNSSMEKINKATLFREILPDTERGVEISQKTVYGLVLMFYSRNIPLFNK